MRTPKDFSENIKNGIITTEMLNECLYSVNKRAKNYRDAKRECYGRYRDSNECKEKNFYHKKEKLLSVITPVCIHKSMVGYERVRVYDYEQNFNKRYLEKLLLNQVVHTNTYWDYTADMEVFFFDYCDTSRPKYLYFLFYELGTKSYHTPVNNPNKYDLPIKEIGRLDTEGNDYRELISVQFVDKVIELIDSGEYTYKETEPTVSLEYKNEIPNSSFSDEVPDYFAFAEIRGILNDYVMREVEKRSLEICKDKPFEFHTEDFKFRQKYVKRYDAYKQPDVYAFRKTKCKKINYELNETTVKKLQNIAKQQKFAISDIVNVICDTLPTDVYENYYQDERLNQVAKKLRQLAREEYEKHKGEKIELTIEKLAEKCGLMSGDLDKSTHKSL